MDVTVSEVGPRDGLQSIKRTLPTEAKHRWIAALAQAGLREIEVGSFVSPKVLPQMADCAEVVARARSIPGLRVVALVPNLRYATMAFEAGTHVDHHTGIGERAAFDRQYPQEPRRDHRRGRRDR